MKDNNSHESSKRCLLGYCIVQTDADNLYIFPKNADKATVLDSLLTDLDLDDLKRDLDLIDPMMIREYLRELSLRPHLAGESIEISLYA